MKVIYFDGVCGLCNSFVDFIMKIDRKAAFHFSPLQSDYAKAHLPPEYTTDLKTVVVQMNGQNLKKSRAVFAVFHELGGIWRVVSWLRILPEGLVNTGYDLVAKYRYKIFGQKETCRLPSPQERQRFIL